MGKKKKKNANGRAQKRNEKRLQSKQTETEDAPTTSTATTGVRNPEARPLDAGPQRVTETPRPGPSAERVGPRDNEYDESIRSYQRNVQNLSSADVSERVMAQAQILAQQLRVFTPKIKNIVAASLEVAGTAQHELQMSHIRAEDLEAMSEILHEGHEDDVKLRANFQLHRDACEAHRQDVIGRVKKYENFNKFIYGAILDQLKNRHAKCQEMHGLLETQKEVMRVKDQKFAYLEEICRDKDEKIAVLEEISKTKDEEIAKLKAAAGKQ